ncbi:hypothetical protein, partial [Vibrio cholerae]|uniref:hypothetical protein n=1 Tax=Vibrio cholerae TaxID=666 RepID=UPI00372D336F
KVKYSYGDFLPSSSPTFDLYIAFGTWQTLEKGELQIPYFLHSMINLLRFVQMVMFHTLHQISGILAGISLR